MSWRPIEEPEPAELSEDLSVEVWQEPAATVIRLSGEFDVVSVAAVRQRLLDLAIDGQVNQVLDLTPVTFMDSAGLGALIAVRRRLQTLQGALVLSCTNDTILRLLRWTSLDKVLRIYPTVDEAIAAEFAE